MLNPFAGLYSSRNGYVYMLFSSMSPNSVPAVDNRRPWSATEQKTLLYDVISWRGGAAVEARRRHCRGGGDTGDSRTQTDVTVI